MPRVKRINPDTVVKVFLQSPRRERFRFIRQRWWVFMDEYWKPDAGTLHLDRAILSVIRDDMDNFNLVETYLLPRIRTKLAGWLTAGELPGRLADDLLPSILDD